MGSPGSFSHSAAGPAAAQISFSPPSTCPRNLSCTGGDPAAGSWHHGYPLQLRRASARLLPATPATQQELSAPQGKILSAPGEDFTQATQIPSYSRAKAGWKQHGHEPELPANPAGAWAQTGPDVPNAASKPAPGKEKGSNAAPQQANTPPAPQERKPGLRAAHGQPHPTTGSAPHCQPQPSPLIPCPPGVGASLSAPPEDLASCLEVAAGQEPGEPRRRLSCGCLAGHTPGPGWLEAPWALRRGGAKIPRSPLRHQKCARLPTVPLRRAFYPQGCRAETFPARKRPWH